MALLLPITIIIVAVAVVIVESGPPLIPLLGTQPYPYALTASASRPTFLFELTTAEFSALMLQNASSKPGRGGRRAWWQMH